MLKLLNHKDIIIKSFDKEIIYITVDLPNSYLKHRMNARIKKSYTYKPKYNFSLDSNLKPNVINGQAKVTSKRGKSKWDLEVLHVIM